MPAQGTIAPRAALEAQGPGQSLLDYAVSNSPVIFYIAEVGGLQPLKFISSNIEAITGHDPEMFLNTVGARRNLIHPEDLPAFREAVNDLKARKPVYETFSHEYRFLCTDGNYVWFRDELTMSLTEDGATQVIGCMIDITAEKESQAALERSEQRFQFIVEGSPLPVVVTDVETGAFLYESPAGTELLGRAADGKRDTVAMAHYGAFEDGRRLMEVLRRDGEVRDFDMLIRKVDGTEIWSSLSARLYRTDGRDVAITIIADQSERHRREEELRQAHETLEDAIATLSEGFALYDENDKLLMCNEPFKRFNPKSGDLYVPGAWRHDILRVGVERGQFPGAEGREKKWLAARRAEGRTMQHDTYKTSDGRWFERSHRPTRQDGLVVTLRDITEQRAMEQSLRDNEALVRRVLDNCPLPIQLVKLDGSLLYESPASSALFKRSLKPGDSVLPSYVDPEERKPYAEQVKRNGRVDDYECQRIREDGTTFTASIAGRLIDCQGEPVVVSSTIDLTEHKEQEAELRRAREMLEDAIEGLAEGIVLFAAAQNVVTCNARYREFTSMTEDKLLPGTPREDFIRAGIDRGQYEHVAYAGRTYEYPDTSADLEDLAGRSWEFQQADGRWFLAANCKTRQGMYVGSRVDITERKIMEEALQESEAMFRRVLDACPVPITMYNITDATILYETPAAKKLFGSEARTGDVNRSSRWADTAERDRQLARLREVGYMDSVEVAYRKADGTIFPAAISARHIEYRGDDVIVTSVFDLSEMRAVEEEMARQREVLHQSEKLSAIGELLAGVSHELNNPLSVLLGQATLLKDGANDEEVQRRAEKLYSAADRCARIVKTFLALARQRPLASEPTNLNDLIEEALEVTGYSLRSSDIEVLPRLAPSLPDVLADRDQIRQVITNLVINAQHALQESNAARQLKIQTSYRRRTNDVVLKVKDNGPGVPAEIRGRIFEPLFTTKDVGVGTGIGLALCHRIVEAHGGTIVLESGADEGAAFAIRLPVDPDSVIDDDASAAKSRRTTGCDILIIDDEPDVAIVLSELLAADGHSTTVALSGDEGLRAVQRADFDVIFCDIRMPVMDGPGFYHALAKLRPNLASRLAFVTGDYLNPRARRFLDATGCPTVEKPANPADLRR
ncbi:MAG: PAS domain S-box protein, partial [Rhodospirillaceae bacterium]|nr:PAS domain S-box protein [Rhodospirillaceae bacterium]